MKYRGIDINLTEDLFPGDRGTFIRGEYSGGLLMRGTTPTSLHKNSLPPLQNNASMLRCLPETPTKSAKKLRNLSLTQRYRAEQFPNDLNDSGDCCFANSVSILSIGNV